MKISNRFDLGSYFTFEPSKEKPIYNWFHYKEAYSPEFVEKILDGFQIRGKVLDPFCGIGTTALVAKSRGMNACGIDSSPLAVCVANVKTRNYSQDELLEVENFMKGIFQKKTGPKLPKLKWDFELFRIEKAFPPANLRNILYIREKITEVENEKARNFLLLALISLIPMCSFVLKDGGVLKLVKKSVAPVKEMFKRKVKKMLRDLRESPITGAEPEIFLGDARKMDLESGTMDAIITSPPYLNAIDYTKVYGLELSLLEMDPQTTKKARERCLRSSITASVMGEDLPPEAGEIGNKIPVIGAYFFDMEKVLEECYRVLKPGSFAVFVVGNTVIHETHILVDEILAEMGARLGFEPEILVGLERIADIKPAKVRMRESAVIFKKA